MIDTTIGRDADRYVCAFFGRRDYYQVPIALAEARMLEAFVTDAYYTGLPRRIERCLPGSWVERLQFRSDSGIPSGRVVSRWDLIAERQIRRNLGHTEWELFSKIDAKLSLAAAQEARRSRSNLLLYNPYAWEAFTARYSHTPRKVMFQYHPHPDLERKILLKDSLQHHFFEYSYESEMGVEADEKAKQRTRDCWRHADLILCASAFTRSSLLEAGAAPEKCHIVPYGIDVSFDRGIIPPESFHVSFVGSGTQRKGLHHLILAWQKAALPTGSRLTVVCRYIDAGLKRIVNTVPGVNLIHGLGSTALRDLYSRSALLAMPSLVEGFGQVYLEALSEGCPVLGTPNSCLPDLGPTPAIKIVEAGGIDQLVAELETLARFLPGNYEVRRQARACAMRWPWAQFRSDLRSAIA